MDINSAAFYLSRQTSRSAQISECGDIDSTSQYEELQIICGPIFIIGIQSMFIGQRKEIVKERKRKTGNKGEKGRDEEGEKIG